MAYKPGLYSTAIAAQKNTDERLKKQSEQKGTESLKELGKYSAFKEVFEGIALENQDFSYVNINEDIINNPNFIEGRNFGFVLIKNGFSEEKYSEYIKATSTKKHR